jgi:hypothetical protein
MYGSERWTLTRSNDGSLSVFERKVLRRIFGPVCEHGFWRKIYNSELYELFSEPVIVKTMKIARLRWAGHVSECWTIIPSKNS